MSLYELLVYALCSPCLHLCMCAFVVAVISHVWGGGGGGGLSIISFNYPKHTKRPKLTSLLWLLKKPCIFHD